MKKSLLEGIINFFLGVFWALLLLSAFLAFESFYMFGFFPALFSAFISSIIWIILIVVLEMANIQIQKYKEIKKQTEILERLEKKLG